MSVRITRILVGIIFLASAILKIFTPNPFLRMFYEIGFGLKLAFFVGIITILIELYLSFLLFFNKNYAIIQSFIYMSIITLLLIILWLSGVSADCGCFGNFIQIQIGPLKILQNSVIILMLFLAQKKIKTNH